MRHSWIWTTLLLLTIIAVFLMLFTFPGSPLRPFVLFWFLLFCPGFALVRVLGFSSHPAMTITLATSLSIALDTICASILLYASAWSPLLILMILAWFTLTCVLIHLLQIIFHTNATKSLGTLEITRPQIQVVRSK